MRFGALGPVTAWTDAGTPVVIQGLKVRAGGPAGARRAIERGSDMARRKAQAWQRIVAGAVTIVVGVVLLAKHIPVLGVSALPIVGAGTAPLLVGLRQLFAARQDHRAK
jgi:predicted phage tail protein